METRKQQLLRRHRRGKRISMVLALLVLVALDWFAGWNSLPVLLILAWIAHEAWLADQLFYSPREDYRYAFPDSAQKIGGRLNRGQLVLEPGELSDDADTLMLEVQVRTTWLGRWLDPHVLIADGQPCDRQDFERGARGRRYLNLSGLLPALKEGRVQLRTRFCRLAPEVCLYVFSNPDYAARRVMVIAPHADDAELAAFGLYSRSAQASIVTLTQGEIEAQNYRRLGLDKAAAARLKGRLRSWSSLAVPLWGGVPENRCVQLGYYCLQLAPMVAEPDKASLRWNPAIRISAACAVSTPWRYRETWTVYPAGTIWWATSPRCSSCFGPKWWCCRTPNWTPIPIISRPVGP